MSADRESQLRKEVSDASNAETPGAVKDVLSEIMADPIGSARRLYEATESAANAVLSDPAKAQAAGLEAFLANPPNPSDLKRKVGDYKRLRGILPGDTERAARRKGCLATSARRR